MQLISSPINVITLKSTLSTLELVKEEVAAECSTTDRGELWAEQWFNEKIHKLTEPNYDNILLS